MCTGAQDGYFEACMLEGCMTYASVQQVWHQQICRELPLPRHLPPAVISIPSASAPDPFLLRLQPTPTHSWWMGRRMQLCRPQAGSAP
jgi:hypothetical protein